MSTPTPRTDAIWDDLMTEIPSDLGWIAAHRLHEHTNTLETELTTALARVAELEEESAKWRIEWRGLRDAVLREDNSPVANFALVERETNRLHERNDSLTRQLSESQAQLASAEEEIKKLQTDTMLDCEYAAQQNVKIVSLEAQLECANRNYEEEKQIVSRIWKLFGNPTYAELKGRSIYDLITELQSQLTSAREDSAKAMDALRDIVAISAKEPENLHESQVQRYSSFAISIAATALGHLAETPAGEETGQDAWQDIATAPKDSGRHFLGFVVWAPGVEECALVCAYSAYHGKFVITGRSDSVCEITHWQPLPPPPQGKETQE